MPKRKPRRRRANGEGSIYLLPDGRWRVAFTQATPSGRIRKYRTRRSHADAVAALDEMRREAPTDALVEPTRLTVGEYLDQWLKLHVAGLAPNTLVTYRTAVEKHIKPRLGRLPLRKLAPLHVTQWVVNLEADQVGPRARQAAFAVLRSALSHAVSPLRLLVVSPCESIKSPRHRRKDIRPFEAAEVKRILAETRGTRWYAFFALAFGVGLRQGELLGLHWSEVDLKKEQVVISRQLTEAAGKAELTRPKTKNSLRTVKLPQHAVRALREHRAILLKAGLAASPLVFPNTFGNFQSKSNLHAGVWKPLLARLKLDQRGVHHCRHTFATLALISGVPVATVSKILGHANPAITLSIYAHCLPSTESAAAAAMDRLLG